MVLLYHIFQKLLFFKLLVIQTVFFFLFKVFLVNDFGKKATMFMSQLTVTTNFILKKR